MTKFFCISYVPRLYGNPLDLVAGSDSDFEKKSKEVAKIVDEAHSNIAGVLWAKNEDGIHPIFIIRRAKEVYDHIFTWSENDPASWFHVAGCQDGSEYALGLTPNLEKSLERFKTNLKITGKDIPADVEYMIVFKPLVFTGMAGQASKPSVDALGKTRKTVVGFMDTHNWGRDTGAPIDEKKIWLIKDVPVRWDDDWFRSELKDRRNG